MVRLARTEVAKVTRGLIFMLVRLSLGRHRQRRAPVRFDWMSAPGPFGLQRIPIGVQG
jgi:hypothetical protein